MTASPLVVLAGVLLAAGAALSVYRIVRGPSILDRMIASDVLLTTTMLALGAVMAVQRRTDLLPVLLVLAGTAACATVAVARSVSKHDRRDPDAGRDPLATIDDATAVLARAERAVADLDDEHGRDAAPRPPGTGDGGPVEGLDRNDPRPPRRGA